MNKQAGFSLLEALIAVAILATIGMSLGRYVMSFKATSRGQEQSFSCRARADVVINALKNLDNKTQIDNYQPCPNCLPPAASPSFKYPERFEGGRIPLVQSSPPLISEKTNTWMLIDGGLNVALNLYNEKSWGGLDFCSGLGVQIAGATPVSGPNVIATNPPLDLQALLTQVSAPLTNEKDFLQVQLVNLTTHLPVKCGDPSYTTPGYTGPQRIIPLGAQNSSMPETNLGIQLTSTVQFTNQAGVKSQCTASTILKHDGNTQGPQFLWDPELLFTNQFSSFVYPFYCIDYNPYICMGGTRTAFGVSTYPTNYPYNYRNPFHVFCGNASTHGSVHFAVAVNSAAVTFGCFIQYSTTQLNADSATGILGYTGAQPAPPVTAVFQPCDGATFPTPLGSFTTTLTQVTAAPTAIPMATTTPNPHPSPTTLNTGNITAAEITAQNLPDGFYTIFIRVYDSAQNQSTVAQSFAVDNTRPSQVAPVPSTAVYTPVPPAGLIQYSATLGEFYQCGPSNGMQYWGASGVNGPLSGIPDVAPSGALWKLTSSSGTVLINNGQCQQHGIVPTTLTPGKYTMTAQACDDCNEETGTGGPYPPTGAVATATWEIFSAATCPAPAPSPVPAPAPSPWGCCLYTNVQCVGTGGVCSWAAPGYGDYYSFAAGGGTRIVMGASVPDGSSVCNNQPICNVLPNSSKSACSVAMPCPVLLQKGAICGNGYECSSGICAPLATTPGQKACD